LAQSLEDKNINTGVGELENELDYQITDSISYYNNMFYNYDEGTISKNLNVLTYKDDTVAFSISHLYRNTFLPKTTTYTPYTSYMSSSITYKYNKQYTYSANIAYDLERSEKKSSEIGFLYSKRCWDFGIRYVENNRPILNTSGTTDNVYDRYIFFTIALKPIMSSGQKSSGFVYKIPDKSTGG
jgi:LPS-assembly protein